MAAFRVLGLECARSKGEATGLASAATMPAEGSIPQCLPPAFPAAHRLNGLLLGRQKAGTRLAFAVGEEVLVGQGPWIANPARNSRFLEGAPFVFIGPSVNRYEWLESRPFTPDGGRDPDTEAAFKAATADINVFVRINGE